MVCKVNKIASGNTVKASKVLMRTLTYSSTSINCSYVFVNVVIFWTVAGGSSVDRWRGVDIVRSGDRWSTVDVVGGYLVLDALLMMDDIM